jgi:hypothetical protein
MSKLRSNFGRHHEAVWEKLAEQLGGEFLEKGTWQADKVRVTVDEWTITLDVRAVPGYKGTEYFTRLRAPYVNADGFRFTVYRKHVFSQLAAFLGMEDIATGHPDFDDKYIVQANDEDKIKRLLGHDEIRTLMEALGDFYFHVTDDEGYHADAFPEGVDELYFEVREVIDKIDRLKQCYDLFALVLRALCHMGSAYETDPHFVL